MSDIVAANVSYSFSNRDKQLLGPRGFAVRGTISFGNGSLTYPSGGVPITKGKMGLPRFVRSLQILEQNAKGYTIEYDVSAEKLRIFQAPAVAVTGNVAAVTGNVAAPTISFGDGSGNIAADKVVGVAALSNGTSLVANTVITGVTGVQAPAFTGDAPAFTGDTAAAARLSELSGGSTAVQAVVLEVLAEGY